MQLCNVIAIFTELITVYADIVNLKLNTDRRIYTLNCTRQ